MLGATRVDVGQGEQSWIVLADPEGNEFCVLVPRLSYGTYALAALGDEQHVADRPSPRVASDER